VGSHLSAIGFSDAPLDQQLQRLIPNGRSIGMTEDGTGRVTVHQDTSGSRIAMTMERDVLVCLTPTFRPGQPLMVTVGSFAPDGCPYERPLMVEVLENGMSQYPLAVQIEDLALGDTRFVPGSLVRLEVAALAESIEVFADEESYYATGTPMASRSVIPSGLFAPPGSPAEEGFTPAPRMLMRGVVVSSDVRRHSVLGEPFVRMTVSSYAASYEVLVAGRDLADPTGRPIAPPPGAVINGQFWLSGRLLEGR
jgi:hypothetical protein